MIKIKMALASVLSHRGTERSRGSARTKIIADSKLNAILS